MCSILWKANTHQTTVVASPVAGRTHSKPVFPEIWETYVDIWHASQELELTDDVEGAETVVL